MTEILQECTTVTKKGKCVDVSVPRGECRTETFCDGACPLPRTATGPIDGEPPLDGAPRQARVNRKYRVPHSKLCNFLCFLYCGQKAKYSQLSFTYLILTIRHFLMGNK